MHYARGWPPHLVEPDLHLPLTSAAMERCKLRGQFFELVSSTGGFMRVMPCFALSAAVLASASAVAQNYPGKPVRIIVPFAAGGATDIVTRVVAQKLNEIWG